MTTSSMRDVFLTRDEVRTLRRLVLTDDRARAAAQMCIVEPALSAMARPVFIPPPHPCRYQDYFDPHTGQPLVWDPASPQAHRSPTGQVFHGDSHDRAWVSIHHNHNANAARNCALAAAICDTPRAADRAHALLMGYARSYLQHPPIGRLVASWGRVMTSGLEEAVWSISMLWAAQLLHQAGRLSDDELDQLRTGLFEPVVDLLWGEWYFIHNIRMWMNAAIGSIGLAFNDRAAIRHAIFGPMGYRQQLIDGFRADGLHVEGSPGYHAYGGAAVLILAEAMARNGFEPYREDHLLQAMLTPIRIAQPDGSPPALNDYWPAKALPTRLYGTLLHRVDNPQVRAAAGLAFTQWQAQGYGPDKTVAPWNDTTAYHARQQVDWLLAWHRIPDGDQQQARPEPVVSLAASGVGIVRPDDDSYLLLKCSRKGSGHDHHDKLSLIWWKHGTCWLTDMGSASYGAHLHENWFKHTLSHNTLMVDGKAHERGDAHLTACNPRLLAGQASPYPSLMPDVTLTRRVAISEAGGLFDHAEAAAGQARTIDYILRPLGELKLPGDAITTPATLALPHHDKALNVPQHARLVTLPGQRVLSWRQGSQVLRVDLSELPGDALVYLADAPIEATNHLALGQMLILRQVKAHAVFRVRLAVGGVLAPSLEDQPATALADHFA